MLTMYFQGGKENFWVMCSISRCHPASRLRSCYHFCLEETHVFGFRVVALCYEEQQSLELK